MQGCDAEICIGGQVVGLFPSYRNACLLISASPAKRKGENKMIAGLKKEILHDLDEERNRIDVIDRAIEEEETWKALRQIRCFITSLTLIMAKLENCHEIELKE